MAPARYPFTKRATDGATKGHTNETRDRNTAWSGPREEDDFADLEGLAKNGASVLGRGGTARVCAAVLHRAMGCGDRLNELLFER